MTLQLPNLRKDQKMILRHPSRTKVLCAGRRWGKTVLGGTTSLYFASQGARVAWTVPTYKNGRPLWRWAENTVAPLKKSKQVDVSRAERAIQFSSGGFLGIYSMDNEDSIRGEAFHLVIVDEAARVPEDAWTDAIMPTLADYDGRAILISTPKGKNWFWKEWLHGQEGRSDIQSWQAPTADNPNPRIKRAAELARDRVPERTYQQEWLAQFVDDGSIFRGVQAAATATREPRQDGHTYVMGCDWGKYNDYTVLTMIDATTHRMVECDRFNQIDYTLQIGRVIELARRYEPDVIVAEKNSIGDPILERLYYEHGLPVQPFTTTNASKAKVIDALSLAFERGSLAILSDPTLIGELQAYEAERLPSGLLRYNAPEGMHDDHVISLALAWHGAQWANPVE
jgi:phage terminase large subunit-like protein